ncbi:MAG: hypothetical protein OXJ64_05285 [Boseongicola sp.]|nr:hypothetical protein [Boseongicola sp.]
MSDRRAKLDAFMHQIALRGGSFHVRLVSRAAGGTELLPNDVTARQRPLPPPSSLRPLPCLLKGVEEVYTTGVEELQMCNAGNALTGVYCAK